MMIERIYMKSRWGVFFFCMILAALYASTDYRESQEELQLITKEQPLGKVHPGIMHETIELSPNKRRIRDTERASRKRI